MQLADCLGGSTGSSLDASQKRRLQESRLAAYERKATRLASMEGFLPKLLQPSAWTCPSTPSAFEPGNAADVDVLKTLRAHPRDFAIRFQASDHTYYIEGVQTHGSVTSMIHAFSEPFQPDLVIAKMMQGRNWPRAGYLKRDVSFAVMTRLRILCPGLLDLYAGNPRDDVSICNVLRGVSDYADISHEITQLSLSPQEIKDMWADGGRQAAHYGTYMHYLFEAFINGQPVPATSPEVRMLQTFLHGIAGTSKALRTEWTIYGEEEKIAGSIDFCAQSPDGRLILVDWKRTAGLPGKFTSFERMRPPLAHIPDCTGMHYRLQLNVYRHLLEKYYGLRVSRMLVVCCHPEHFPTPFVDEVPRMERETKDMLHAWCEDRLGGASQASNSFPEVGQEVVEDDESRADARLVARENTFRVPDEVEIELEHHLEDSLDLDLDTGAGDSRLQQARKRRLLPGADSTMNEFQNFFSSLYEAADASLAEVPLLIGVEEPSIPSKVAQIRQTILRKFPRMEESLVRVVTGAITVYRLRLTDLHLRELVVLLWIIEGEQFMRCHDGNLYFFHLGAFALHKGVPPQGTLARCKRFFVQLEGLFRQMGGAKLTTDEDVLNVVQDLLEAVNNSARQLLNECEDAAFGHIPRGAGASRGRARENAEPGEQEPVAVAASAGRCQGLADALTKAGYSMQNELLRDKFFSLVVEWCDTPQMRSAGISYTDCAFLYDQAPGQNVTPARGVPEDNIYVHIPHPLLNYTLDDPVLLRAQESLQRFYSETFWLNNDAPPLLPAVVVYKPAYRHSLC